MRLIVPDASLIPMMLRVIGMGESEVKYRLFTNNHTVTQSTLLSNLTEAAWSGYAAVSVVPADFTIQSQAGHLGTIIAPPIQFGNSSGVSQGVWGFFVTNVAGDILLWAGNYDTVAVFVPSGGGLDTIPTLQDTWKAA